VTAIRRAAFHAACCALLAAGITWLVLPLPAVGAAAEDGAAAEIQALIQRFASSFQARDPEAFVSLFADPAVFDDPHRGEAELDAAALLDMIRSDFAGIQEVRRYDPVHWAVTAFGESTRVEVTFAVEMTIFETDDAFRITYGWELASVDGAWRIARLWVVDMQR